MHDISGSAVRKAIYRLFDVKSLKKYMILWYEDCCRSPGFIYKHTDMKQENRVICFNYGKPVRQFKPLVSRERTRTSNSVTPSRFNLATMLPFLKRSWHKMQNVNALQVKQTISNTSNVTITIMRRSS